MSIILDVTEPLVFHHAFDVLAFVRLPVAVAFLILYQSKSRWAWYLIVVWWPFAVLAYWILRFTGYSRYQPRVHSTSFDLGFVLFDVVLFVAVLVWLLRIRQRYIRYIQDANSSET